MLKGKIFFKDYKINLVFIINLIIVFINSYAARSFSGYYYIYYSSVFQLVVIILMILSQSKSDYLYSNQYVLVRICEKKIRCNEIIKYDNFILKAIFLFNVILILIIDGIKGTLKIESMYYFLLMYIWMKFYTYLKHFVNNYINNYKIATILVCITIITLHLYGAYIFDFYNSAYVNFLAFIFSVILEKFIHDL